MPWWEFSEVVVVLQLSHVDDVRGVLVLQVREEGCFIEVHIPVDLDLIGLWVVDPVVDSIQFITHKSPFDGLRSKLESLMWRKNCIAG